MTLSKKLIELILIATLVGATTPVVAQYSGMGGNMSRRSGGSGASRNSDVEKPDRSSQNSFTAILESVSKIESEMNFDAFQSPKWSTFIESIQYFYAIGKSPVISSDSTSNPSFGMRFIRNAVDQSQDRYAAMKHIEDTAKNLYDSLNTDQKAVFDQKIMLIIPHQKK